MSRVSCLQKNTCFNLIIVKNVNSTYFIRLLLLKKGYETSHHFEWINKCQRYNRNIRRDNTRSSSEKINKSSYRKKGTHDTKYDNNKQTGKNQVIYLVYQIIIAYFAFHRQTWIYHIWLCIGVFCIELPAQYNIELTSYKYINRLRLLYCVVCHLQPAKHTRWHVSIANGNSIKVYWKLCRLNIE